MVIWLMLKELSETKRIRKRNQIIILCCLSTGILDDEDDPETLINVNMVDAERALRNVENKKKKPDYNPYDDAEEDEYGMVGNGVCGELTSV